MRTRSRVSPVLSSLRRAAAGCAAAVVVSSLALASAVPPASAKDPDHAEHEHATIRILESRLHPETARIHAGDALAWLNYARQRAEVSFDADVLEHMVCRSPGGFHREGERLTSGEIEAHDFASLCSFQPGEYAYRVELAPGEGAGAGGTMRTLTGRVVVAP